MELQITLVKTQVKTAIDYYKKFIKKWPNLKSLAQANTEDILTIWSGLGYYNRAKNLLKAAKIINKKYNGNIPDKYEYLISLPGIGEYTAAAIISFAFGKFSVVIDTNIKRFIVRVNGLNKHDVFNKSKINDLGKKLFFDSNSGKLAQAIMDFSSDICTKKNPSCSKCFLNNICRFDLSLEEYKTKQKAKKKYSLVIFYIFKKKYFFLKKRSLSKTLGGMYEIPGTDWYDSTWPKSPVRLNSDNALSKIIRYKLSNTDLHTKIYKVNVKNKDAIKEKGIWVSNSDLNKIPISVLTKKIINFCMSKK